MKKNNYLNKSQKFLLATMIVPLTISALPKEETVYASSEVPSLNIYELNGSPKLEWATEILEENVLQKINFEKTNISNNHFSISNDAYEGNKALRIHKTFDEYGNFYGDEGELGSSFFNFNQQFKFNNNDNLSVSLKAKNINATDSTLVFQTVGMLINKPPTYSSLTNNKKITFKENVSVGQNYFYVNDVNTFKELIKDKNYVVLSKPVEDGNYEIGSITSFDEKTGKVTVSNVFQDNFLANEEVYYALWTNPILFNQRLIEGNEWKIYNYNKLVSNSDYNFDTRSVIFEVLSRTNGDFLIDDIVIGYATEVEIYREGKSIYRGYLSDFHDTTIKDNVKPNVVKEIKTSIGNDFKVKFNPIKPLDKGLTTSYTIQAILKNGTRSVMSNPQNITITGEVIKYKYALTKSAIVPNNLSNITNELEFDLPINSINLEEDYIHIQSIDDAGNESKIETFKISDIIDKSLIQSVYDKLNQVEDTMNYTDFIHFIDEVESMYGDNLPEDIKQRIEDLGNYHGVNTTFLQLLEGDFSLRTKDITSFGQVKLTAEKQVLKTNFTDNFTVIDARGTQQGWKVNVSATPFIEDTFNGFVGEPTQLPIGTLAINTAHDIKQVGIVHESKLPSAFTNDFAIIDSGEVTVLNADKGEGMGEFTFNFGEDALSMVVDSTTAKIDNVNYPEGITPYTSTITWNLITGP